jgi:hypothetical protein
MVPGPGRGPVVAGRSTHMALGKALGGRRRGHPIPSSTVLPCRDGCAARALRPWHLARRRNSQATGQPWHLQTHVNVTVAVRAVATQMLSVTAAGSPIDVEPKTHTRRGRGRVATARQA